MLKIALLLALGAVCAVGGEEIGYSRQADMQYMYRQKKIYELLLYVKQNDFKDAEFYNIGRSFTIEDDMYNDKNIVQRFRYYYQNGLLLKRNAIFSPYIDEHINETKMLFELFYSAKDFDIFYNTACWARAQLNDAVFTSAFTVAIFYRPDCKYMKPPPIYEIYPNFFFDSKVIQEAQQFKWYPEMKQNMCSIYTNYTGMYVTPSTDIEYNLDYFMEDADINAFYYYFRQMFPYWLRESFMSHNYQIPKNIRGQLYYYVHRQLIARYYLERLSNGLGSIDDFDWYKPIFPGYYSQMTFPNGMIIPQRDSYSMIPHQKYRYLKEISVLESRIMNAIDSGVFIDESGKEVNIYTPEGLNVLANMIEGNIDSCNLRFYGKYESLARNILGFSLDFKNKNNIVPSALQCYSTSMRDPAFYMLYKRIMSYFLRYKKNQPIYTEQDLKFPGVEFKSVEVGKLKTYFGSCSSVGNSALGASVHNFSTGMSFLLKICRPCLKYEPFTYKINVYADGQMDAVLRIFLGPAFDDVDMDGMYLQKYYYAFAEMDKFNVTLQSGMNEISRSSSQSSITMPDMIPSNVFYTNLNKAISGGRPFAYSERLFGFPERFTLPKGRPEGMKFKMFFFLSRLDTAEVYELPMFGNLLYDGKSFGFPLDRPMSLNWKQNFTVPNMYLKDVYIFNEPRITY